MAKADTYHAQLRTLESWNAWLQQESGLPGPCAYLELIAAIAEKGDETFFQRYLAFTAAQARCEMTYPGDSVRRAVRSAPGSWEIVARQKAVVGNPEVDMNHLPEAPERRITPLVCAMICVD